jgi:Holliday junction resolvasome RuvABC DNA-binding subunit
MELKDKLAQAEPAVSGLASGVLLARDALVELGWSVVDADRALAEVDESLPVEEQVRVALKKAA